MCLLISFKKFIDLSNILKGLLCTRAMMFVKKDSLKLLTRKEIRIHKDDGTKYSVRGVE